MTENQKPTRRPAFVTQRDGSSLANSNCRMASICMGLDYETAGAKKSTGSKMRSYTSDQSGGTDSGDAKEAWDNGYNESLDSEDGKTFSDALASLKAGRVVHLDVWHKTLADGCISGSGEYGHTICVLPDFNGEWMVGDPWCQITSSNTDGYTRIPESKLKAAAEEWGRRVYGAAVLEADYDSTQGPDSPINRIIARRIVKRFMDASYPEHESPLPGPLPLELRDFPDSDTGGAQPILFTRTSAQPLETDMIPLYSGCGKMLVIPEGTPHYEYPGGPETGAIGNPAGKTVYAVVAQDAEEKPSWYLINGGAPGLMRWVYKGDVD